MLKIVNAYNYKQRQSCRMIEDVEPVPYVDTSIAQAQKDNNVSLNAVGNATFCDSERPVNVFGSGILMTEFDPILQHRLQKEKKQVEQVAQQQVTQQQNSKVEPSNNE